MPVVVSAAAEVDLEAITDFTKDRWGAAKAHSYVSDIEGLFAELARFPQLGVDRSQLHAGLRSFPIESHVVYYRPTESGVEIVRVLHGRQDARRHLQPGKL